MESYSRSDNLCISLNQSEAFEWNEFSSENMRKYQKKLESFRNRFEVNLLNRKHNDVII